MNRKHCIVHSKQKKRTRIKAKIEAIPSLAPAVSIFLQSFTLSFFSTQKRLKVSFLGLKDGIYSSLQNTLSFQNKKSDKRCCAQTLFWATWRLRAQVQATGRLLHRTQKNLKLSIFQKKKKEKDNFRQYFCKKSKWCV